MPGPVRSTESTPSEPSDDSSGDGLAGLAPGERRTVEWSEIEHVAGDTGSGDQRAYARAWLIHNGLRSDPPRSPEGQTVTVRLSPYYALQAAAVVVVALAAGLAAGRVVYGAVMAVLGLAALLLIGLGWKWVTRTAPASIPRGRVLGLLVLAPFVVLALLANAGLRQKHIDDVRHDRVVRDLSNANRALDRGDLGAATALLLRAETAEPHAPGVVTVRTRLQVERDPAIRELRRRIALLQAQRTTRER